MGKQLSPVHAAARLGIGVADLPREGAWTRAQVRALRAERPEWLTQARRAYAAGQDEQAAPRRKARAALLDKGEYTAPDTGLDDMIVYAGEALVYLLRCGVAQEDAEAAVERRWPSTGADDDGDFG